MAATTNVGRAGSELNGEGDKEQQEAHFGCLFSQLGLSPAAAVVA